MDTLPQFRNRLTATIWRWFAALGLHWLLLRAAFLLMQPATAAAAPQQPAIVHGTRLVAHAYAQRRRFAMRKGAAPCFALQLFFVIAGLAFSATAGIFRAYDVYMATRL